MNIINQDKSLKQLEDNRLHLLGQLEDNRLHLLNQVDQIDQQITMHKSQALLDAAKTLHRQLSIVTEDDTYRLVSIADTSCNELSEFNLIQIFFIKYSKDYDKQVFNKKLAELIDQGLLVKIEMINENGFINGREINKNQEKSSLPNTIFYMYSTTEKYTELVNPFFK